MIITGKYEKDDNFTTVYADNRVYTIAKNTGDWNSVGVGETAYCGGVITQDWYDTHRAACTLEGTFELSGEDDDDDN